MGVPSLGSCIPLDVLKGWCGAPVGAGSLQSSVEPALAGACVGTMLLGRVDAAYPIPGALKRGKASVGRCEVEPRHYPASPSASAPRLESPVASCDLRRW